VSMRPTFYGSQIEPGRKLDPPATVANPTVVTNATTTSASATSLGGSLIVDVKPASWDWTLSPGAYFSYQPTYVSRGLDFSLGGELFEGNFSPWFSYGVRLDAITGGNLAFTGIFGYGLPRERDEDGEDRRLHSRVTHNFVAGFTQLLSPQWKLGASVQYTLQTGFLATPNAKVLLHEQGLPVLYVDEKLPAARHRFQANLRARFSPALGWSLGMDHSGYIDDWGVANIAIEPGAEGPFSPGVARWRAWYRFSYQKGTRYLRDEPLREHRYQTDDSDLGTLGTNGGGVMLLFYLPRAGAMRWAIRLSGWAYARSDGISGLGVLVGSEVEW